MPSDRDLGLHLPITRRQFCQGAAVAVGASLAPWARADGFHGSPEIGSGYYPPGLTGLRGSQPGSFETAHALVHQGRQWADGRDTGESTWDLVVVGAGISGLAAAWFWQREHADARILVLENHDDFGGHARRNEFTHEGRTLIGYGGSQSIDTPGSFSAESLGLLQGLGIRLDEFYQDFDRGLYPGLGLRGGFFLDREHFGVDRLVRGNPITWGEPRDNPERLREFARDIATSEGDERVMLAILRSEGEPLAGLSPAERVARLRATSYECYLAEEFGAGPQLLKALNPLPKGLWGSGTDAVSALEACKMGFPGFDSLGIDLARDDPHYHPKPDEPYIFHFPDGNAAIPRLIVRQMIPGVAGGSDMHDVVTDRFDYTALDRPGQPVCLRLNATVVRAENLPGNGGVRVRYVKGGAACDVHARNVIWGGYAHMLRHVCPEFPAAQAKVFDDLPKIPLVYASVLIREWQPFVELGINRVVFPGGLMDSMALDFPVSIGDYRFNSSPDQPAILHWQYIPANPGDGRDSRQQARDGRRRMLGMSFEEYERAIRSQSAAALAAGGFDPARDILALTVNRWPHGYAWEYNDLFDPPDHNRYHGPHIEARRGFGRIAIAGSDAEAFAYVNGSVDSAWRAVRELLG